VEPIPGEEDPHGEPGCRGRSADAATTTDPKATAAKLAEYKAHIAKWTNDLVDEQQKAEGFESAGELAEARADHLDLGEALLQISVVLSSITLFTRRRSYFVGGLLLGVAGVVVVATAWLLH